MSGQYMYGEHEFSRQLINIFESWNVEVDPQFGPRKAMHEMYQYSQSRARSSVNNSWAEIEAIFSMFRYSVQDSLQSTRSDPSAWGLNAAQLAEYEADHERKIALFQSFYDDYSVEAACFQRFLEPLPRPFAESILVQCEVDKISQTWGGAAQAFQNAADHRRAVVQRQEAAAQVVQANAPQAGA